MPVLLGFQPRSPRLRQPGRRFPRCRAPRIRTGTGAGRGLGAGRLWAARAWRGPVVVLATRHLPVGGSTQLHDAARVLQFVALELPVSPEAEIVTGSCSSGLTAALTGSAFSRSATMQSGAAQILSRSSSRTVTGVSAHNAATLLSDGVNPTLAKAVGGAGGAGRLPAWTVRAAPGARHHTERGDGGDAERGCGRWVPAGAGGAGAVPERTPIKSIDPCIRTAHHSYLYAGPPTRPP